MLNEKDGGVHPVAVGCSLCCLVAKTAGMAVMESMGSLWSPLQLGYSTPLGSEGVVHANRL